MKKCLVLMVVLAIASLASANVIVSASALTVLPGGSITISVISDNAAAYMKYLDMNKGLAEFALPGTILTAAGNDAAIVDYSTEALTDLELTAVELDTLTGKPVAAGTHFTFTVTAGQTPGIFDVVLLNGSSFESESSVSVQIIPEPATIALLCIGGMLLRKKK